MHSVRPKDEGEKYYLYGSKFQYRSDSQSVIDSKEFFIATYNESCILSLYISISIYLRLEIPLIGENV